MWSESVPRPTLLAPFLAVSVSQGRTTSRQGSCIFLPIASVQIGIGTFLKFATWQVPTFLDPHVLRDRAPLTALELPHWLICIALVSLVYLDGLCAIGHPHVPFAVFSYLPSRAARPLMIRADARARILESTAAWLPLISGTRGR